MQNHVIQELIIEAHVSDRKSSDSLQKQMGFWVHTNAFSKELQQTLDTLVREDVYLEIEYLELQIDFKDSSSFLKAFFQTLKNTIKELESVKKTEKGSTLKKVTKEKRKAFLMTYFLKYGFFPSGSRAELVAEIKKQLKELPILEQPLLVNNIINTSIIHPVIWARLSTIIGSEGILVLLKKQFGLTTNFWKQVKLLSEQKEIKRMNSEDFTLVCVCLVKELLNNNSENEKLKTLYKMQDLSVFNITQERKQAVLPNSLQGILVPNAGIILFWGLFRGLLKRQGWVVDKAFKNEITQQQSILLFHYLATSSVDAYAWEDDLILPKILCGWPIQNPIDVDINLPKKATTEVDLLIADFVGKWMVGKSFSNQWIANRFLQRPGQLSQRSDGAWQLILERKPEDILLNSLPSGIGFSLIRNAWMNSILYVEW